MAQRTKAETKAQEKPAETTAEREAREHEEAQAAAVKKAEKGKGHVDEVDPSLRKVQGAVPMIDDEAGTA